MYFTSNFKVVAILEVKLQQSGRYLRLFYCDKKHIDRLKRNSPDINPTPLCKQNWWLRGTIKCLQS